MRLDQLIQQLDEEPDDVIEFLSAITDENIQALKNNKQIAQLEKIRILASDVLMMLQVTASGGHLIDVHHLQKLIEIPKFEN